MSIRHLLLAAVAGFASVVVHAEAQTASPGSPESVEEYFRRRSLAAQEAAAAEAAKQATADPYPMADAGNGGPDDVVVDPLAPPGQNADLTTGTLPPAPADAAAPTALGLRPAFEVAPLRTVVQPVRRSSEPALPVTGPIPIQRDIETEARGEYDPLGFRIGTFVANATATASVGYTSNAAASAGGSGSAYVRTGGEIALRSDWERHGLDIDAKGSFRRAFDGDTKLDPNAEAKIDGRIDLTDVDKVGISGGWTYTREDAGSAELGTSSSGADINTLSASLGYERAAGMVGLAVKGGVDRSIYEAGEDRTNTAFSGSLRLSLDTGAVVQPFVEGGTFTRRYDNATDSAGYERSSIGYEGKTGVTVDTGTLTGEASVGYAVERPEDDRLDDLSGVTADLALAWKPTELATLNLRGTTTFEPSQITGASGSVVHAIDADLAYALRPNIILSLGGGFSYQDYTGVSRTVQTTSLRAGAEWRLNRTVALGLAATHKTTDSSATGESYDESTVEASVIFRH